MMLVITGLAANRPIVLSGRAALGIQAEADLAVDALVNLSVDASSDLAVTPGETWTGVDATRTVRP